MFAFFRTLELQSKLTLLISASFFVPLIAASIYVATSISRQYQDVYSERAAHAAAFIASSAPVVEALSSPGEAPGDALRHFLDEATIALHVSYIIPMRRDGTPLYSAASKAGSQYIAEFLFQKRPRQPVEQPPVRWFQGGSLQAPDWANAPSSDMELQFSTEQSSATVVSDTGQTLGTVTVGLVRDDVKSLYSLFTQPLQKIMLFAMVTGLMLAIFLARSIKKILLGLEPVQIATLLQERSATLQIMSEGVLAINTDKKTTLVNAEAERILGKAGVVGPFIHRTLPQKALLHNLVEVMQTGSPKLDEEQSVNGVAVLANYMPLVIENQVVGAIVSFRDMSELRLMAERITDINRYVDALRAQSHEFLNKLHVIMGLLKNNQTEQLRDYVAELVDARTQEDKSIQESVRDSVIAGFLSSKHSRARELGASMRLVVDGVLPVLEEKALRNGLITIIGNLIDNALDAMAHSEKKLLSVHMGVSGNEITLFVSDTGGGMDNTALASVYAKNYSTKGPTRGLGLWLVSRTVRNLSGVIDMTSAPGQGTVVKVRLPLPKPTSKPASEHDGPGATPC